MNPQQKRSHVPKFGSWDSDNIPYTAYFENARKEKGSGVMMNPNDPEENPEAFMFGRVGTGSEGHRRNTSDHQKSGSHKSTNSESGSDKSNSGYALQQQNHRRTRSTTRKNSTTEANNFVRPSPAHDRLRSANNPSEDKSYRSVSVPKFGVWDEKDPKSGEGFTVIFNKVKEEKQIAATKLPTVPPQPRNFEKSQKKHAGSKKYGKIDVIVSMLLPICLVMAFWKLKNLFSTSYEKLMLNLLYLFYRMQHLFFAEGIIGYFHFLYCWLPTASFHGHVWDDQDNSSWAYQGPDFVPSLFLTSNDAIVSLFFSQNNCLLSHIESTSIYHSLDSGLHLFVLLFGSPLRSKTMLNRLGTTEDMAAATVFLASGDAS
ncbi:indole-3-butyric acid response 1 [Actinidia rufa]|uniref:Indole-3-butyric acid response 1 n=1 Tax=Actinidia rufa TaxID=165716 RepID=A0A7J0EZ43_9ERIC|nr:indole-3-butyric acid response 1 [Actinidia rufa]